MDAEPQFSWRSAGATDTGNVRKVNEDAMCLRPEVGLWAVADGMGGHQFGDVASTEVIEALARVSYPSDLDQFIATVKSLLVDLNHDMVRREGAGTMGCTVIVLLAFDDECACLWVGDSRAYRLRNDVLYSMTRDHSYVEELVQLGQLAVEDAQNHPQANVLTRAIGAEADLDVEIVRHELNHGDRYLLCSDGLYRELSELELYRHMQRGDVESLVSELLTDTLSRPARDNVSVVVVDFLCPG